MIECTPLSKPNDPIFNPVCQHDRANVEQIRVYVSLLMTQKKYDRTRSCKISANIDEWDLKFKNAR